MRRILTSKLRAGLHSFFRRSLNKINTIIMYRVARTRAVSSLRWERSSRDGLREWGHYSDDTETLRLLSDYFQRGGGIRYPHHAECRCCAYVFSGAVQMLYVRPRPGPVGQPSPRALTLHVYMCTRVSHYVC